MKTVKEMGIYLHNLALTGGTSAVSTELQNIINSVREQCATNAENEIVSLGIPRKSSILERIKRVIRCPQHL
jgi:hypothetical protein